MLHAKFELNISDLESQSLQKLYNGRNDTSVGETQLKRPG